MDQLHASPEEILKKLMESRVRPDVCEYSAPQDELERAMCQLWADVLGLDRVGRDDNILELGGDSYHMAVISARLAETHGLEIQIVDFFEYPTVASLVGFFSSRLRST